MKYNKSNIIKLLEAMEENTWGVAHDVKKEEGNSDFYWRLVSEASAYGSVLRMLKDKKEFEASAKIFLSEECE